MQLESETPESTFGARRFGGHSMTARLRSVLVRKPAPTATDDDWRTFGYPAPVDHDAAVRQHAAFRAILAGERIELVTAGPDLPGQMDAIFAYDPSFTTNDGVILCRPGKEARLQETALAERVFMELGIPVVGRIEAPGTVEGGDLLWLDERTLAVGHGYRTNSAGIEQLMTIMARIGVEVAPVSLPHWRGPHECLHLMSLISPVATDLAVVYPPLMSVAFVEQLRERDWRLIEVPDEEFDSLGCNVLALAPGRCLMIEGNPITLSRLEAEGVDVLTYEGTEISLKRAGGPTCLTRPLWRED